MRQLTVSRASARFLRQGHPWIRPDRFTRGLDALEPGEAVTLVDDQGTGLASALADPGEEICARVYHKLPGKAFDPAAAVTRAWERRTTLHADASIDCYRVVHGEGDFLPGLRVERYAGVLVALLRCPAIAAHTAPICETLATLDPEATIVVREQFDDLRKRPVRTWIHPEGAVDSTAVIEGRELGVRLPLRPYGDLATGIYVDQRATRVWLRERCAGARVLNLFAYTGLFSLSLLQAGASEAHDVDLAATALAVGREAAVSNGLSEHHHSHQRDVRQFLESGDDRFDLVICDPPTAAQGAGGWVARRDYPDVLRAIGPRLNPGARLVAITNTLGKPYDLEAAIRQALPGIAIEQGPELGEDLPQLKGFPEGRPFRLVVARAPD